MTTMNPFDLLGYSDNDDPSQLIESASAILQKSVAATDSSVSKKNPNQTQQKSAKLPTKPLPPSQAVRESKNEPGRGGGRGFGRGGGRGRGGFNRDHPSNGNAFGNSTVPGPQGEEGEGGGATERKSYGAPRGPYRGGRRGGFNNDEGRDGDRPRRTYERHSGTGRGSTEEVVEETEKHVSAENAPAGEEAVDATKEVQPEETEEKEPEEKEMTLEEYEKVREEKRKALLALKTEGRKVEVDKDLQSMQQLSNRKDEESVFIKLGSEKDKKKEVSDKERAKKSVSINEFLKPAEGERFQGAGGRGRGRGRGSRGGSSGGGGSGYDGGHRMANSATPTIEDQKQFPTLGAPRA